MSTWFLIMLLLSISIPLFLCCGRLDHSSRVKGDPVQFVTVDHDTTLCWRIDMWSYASCLFADLATIVLVMTPQHTVLWMRWSTGIKKITLSEGLRHYMMDQGWWDLDTEKEWMKGIKKEVKTSNVIICKISVVVFLSASIFVSL